MSYREPQFQDEPADYYDEEEVVIVDPSAEFTGPIQGMEELKEREEKEARRARRRAERRRQLDMRTGKIVAACLCVCVVVAVIIAISVLKGVEHYIEYGPETQPPHQSSTQNVTGEDGNANDETSVLSPSTPVSSTNSTGGTPSEPSPNNPVGTNSNVQDQSSSTTNGQNAQGETFAPPTEAPTPSPTAVPATPRPTLPLQESYVLEPARDTFVYVDGPDRTKFFGSEESFLVQLGTKVERPGAPLERATAKAVLQFDTGMLPDRSVWPSANDASARPLNATLKVHHVAFKDREDLQDRPNVDVESRPAVQMEVWRLPNTINPDLNIETWTGEAFVATPAGDRTGYLVTTQEVGPDDGWLEIDLHDAIFVPDRVDDDLDYTDEKIILLLSVWPGDSANKQLSVEGDRFHSREAVDDGFSPQLIINNMI